MRPAQWSKTTLHAVTMVSWKDLDALVWRVRELMDKELGRRRNSAAQDAVLTFSFGDAPKNPRNS
jgi:hypothetical protein